MSLAARLSLALLIPLVFATALPRSAAAQWKLNGAPVSTNPVIGRDRLLQISDGNGGVYVTWEASLLDGTSDVVVQHLDMNGYPMWALNGVSVYPSNNQLTPGLCEDGYGGVIVAWADDRNAPGVSFDIYAQRYDEFGNEYWTPGGELVCNATDVQYFVRVASDGFGGAFITWEDFRYGITDVDIFANHIDGAGDLVWSTNGVSVGGATGVQLGPYVVGDGTGGAIITWSDYRSGPALGDVYAQRIDAGYSLPWTFNGLPVCTATNVQQAEGVVSDGIGGAIIVWMDARGADSDIYTQRLDASGTAQWLANGVPICTATGDQVAPKIAGDNAGGAVIVWRDNRNAPSTGVYAERIDGDGATQWLYNGLPLAAIGGTTESTEPSVGSVGGGYVVTWADDRLVPGNRQLYGQLVTYDGVEMWGYAGKQLTTGNWAVGKPVVVDDGFGGAIVSWHDQRNNRADIFAQRLELTHGEWGHPEPIISSAADNPGDQGGYVALDWYASDRDVQPYALITYYSTWRATDAFFLASNAPTGKSGDGTAAAVGVAKEMWPDATIVTSPAEIAPDFDGKAVWVNEGPQGVPSFWEWMTNVTAAYQPGYSYLMPTRADSSATGPATHYFKVIAHVSQFTFWESQYMSGYSVDNLAPGAPLMLTAVRVGNYVRLDWNPSGLDDPDFSNYIVYRATSSGVTPVPVNLVGATGELTLWDQNTPAGTPYYYIVTAKDIHGNQSTPSNEASVDGTATGVGDHVPALTTMQVLPNVPNPFGESTSLTVGMPRDGDATLEVYDVAGHRVAERHIARLARGWNHVGFDGRDDVGRQLASGVYFYRVHVRGEAAYGKMVLQR